jgi:hypothetical protein
VRWPRTQTRTAPPNIVLIYADDLGYDRNTNTELGNDRQPQLYDLAADIDEKNNVAAQNPERVKAMMDHLARIRQ